MAKLPEGIDITQLHTNVLVLLKCIDEICTKYDIDYFMQAGTLLGAVRNGKIIPWDDDADLMMYREEFDRFLEISEEALQPYGMYLNYTDRVPKVCIRSDAYAKVDIFIIDYLPDQKIKKKFKILMLKFLQGMAKEDVDLSAYNLKGKILVFITSTIGRLFSRKLRLKMYQKMSVFGHTGKNQKCFWSNDLYRFIHYEFQRDYFRETIRMEFEGMQLKAPKNWDAYLKINYGEDYLTPMQEDYYVTVPRVDL